MPVEMYMRLAAIPRSAVRMLVVCIMYMLVGMLQFLVHVRMLMKFRQVQPHPERHQPSPQPERDPRTLAQHGERKRRAEERRHPATGAGARRAQMPQRHD